eukprot:7090789-Prymnesium_polylepis.2
MPAAQRLTIPYRHAMTHMHMHMHMFSRSSYTASRPETRLSGDVLHRAVVGLALIIIQRGGRARRHLAALGQRIAEAEKVLHVDVAHRLQQRRLRLEQPTHKPARRHRGRLLRRDALRAQRARVAPAIADGTLEAVEVGLDRLEAQQQVDWLWRRRVASQEEALRVEVLRRGEARRALDVRHKLRWEREGGRWVRARAARPASCGDASGVVRRGPAGRASRAHPPQHRQQSALIERLGGVSTALARAGGGHHGALEPRHVAVHTAAAVGVHAQP